MIFCNFFKKKKKDNLREYVDELINKKLTNVITQILLNEMNTITKTNVDIILDKKIKKLNEEINEKIIKNIELILKNNRNSNEHQEEDNNDVLSNVTNDLSNNTKNYIKKYEKKDTIYWGIGIENETYLKGTPILMSGHKIINSIGRERYSIDYTKNYNIDNIKEVMRSVYFANKKYSISRTINAHCFTKMDIYGEHKTTYEKEPKENIKYSGKNIIEEWFEYDSEIKKLLDPSFKDKTNIFFDGDTIEFITENFYKTNTEDCVNELLERRDLFLKKINRFKKEKHIWDDLGDLEYIEKHPGLNIFQTQKNKIVLFNNTTIHVHITLPTYLLEGKIANESEFLEKHKNAIKMLQWFEPFFICTLGSPDLFQYVYQKYYNNNDIYFSGGSMRNTMSRYIGVGTYDTNDMLKGKIITKSINKEIQWRTFIKSNMLYNLPENEIGLDFNFNKHYQSGFEFRILDGIPITYLKNVLDIIVLICEYSYHHPNISNAPNSSTWNKVVFESMSKGYNSIINLEDIQKIQDEFGIHFNIKNDSLEEFYYNLLENIFEKVKKDTKILQLMTKNFEKITRWPNFNKIQAEEHIKSFSFNL